MSTFGEQVREARNGMGMSLESLARFMGVSKVFVCNVEKGHRKPFSPEKVQAVAAILKLDPMELANQAALERGYVRLEVVKQRPSKARLAAALAHHWDFLDEAAVDKLIGAL